MITPNQKRILDFIRGYSLSNHEAPTIKEIGNHVGFSSPSTVHVALRALEQEGLIRRGRKWRAIEIVEGEFNAS